MHPEFDRPRREREATHLNACGPRAVFECLAEIERQTGAPAIVRAVVASYAHLIPSVVHAVGADRMPPSPLDLVA